MPRKRQRFSKLSDQLRATQGTATAGPVAEYQKWLQGINKINVTRRPSAAHLARFTVGVVPFGISPPASGNKARACDMTVQADIIRALFGAAGADADFGIERTLASIDDAPPGFYPALCKPFVVPANSALASNLSGVTKVSYNRYLGRSGSIPFGRTTTTTTDAQTGVAETVLDAVDEEDVKTTLARKLRGATLSGQTLKGVTFVSEQMNSSRDLRSPKPVNAPTTLPA